jgi:hypothetical protein
VADKSANSQGVWRLTFDPASETVGGPVLLANGAGGLAGNRATATALGPDGALYVGFIRNGNIVRVSNPSGAAQTVQAIGKTSDGRGVSALAFAGQDLYLAQGGAVTRIAAATACVSCTAGASAIAATAPTALASDGINTIYIADTPPGGATNVLRYTISTNTQIIYANTGVLPNLTTVPFQFATGLALDPTNNLFVGDDPTAGAQILQGHVWKVVFVP